MHDYTEDAPEFGAGVRRSCGCRRGRGPRHGGPQELAVAKPRQLLRQRLADFSDAQLGGAFYLFLRGMPEAGVYFARPDDALLDALDRLFEVGR